MLNMHPFYEKFFDVKPTTDSDGWSYLGISRIRGNRELHVYYRPGNSADDFPDGYYVKVVDVETGIRESERDSYYDCIARIYDVYDF